MGIHGPKSLGKPDLAHFKASVFLHIVRHETWSYIWTDFQHYGRQLYRMCSEKYMTSNEMFRSKA